MNDDLSQCCGAKIEINGNNGFKYCSVCAKWLDTFNNPVKYPSTQDRPQQSQPTDDELLESKRIHGKTIEAMEAIGWGLLKDGKTFYKMGYELNPRLHFTFDMSQAYEIVQKLQEAYERGREDFAAEISPIVKSIEKNMDNLISSQRRQTHEPTN